MTPPDATLRRWRDEVRRALPDADRELAEEISQHVAAIWTDVAAARGEDAATRAAFDDLRGWQARGAIAASPRPRRRGLTGLGLDLRAALRAAGRRPVASAGAALLVAIALAANAAAFAVAYGVLLRPLPYPQPDRLVTLWQVERGETGQISYPDYRDLAASGLFDASGAIMTGVGTIMVDQVADRVHALEVDPVVLAELGATPVVGRLLTPEDAAAARVLISHRLWQSFFHGTGDVLGRAFTLSGRRLTVIGVLPQNFDLEMPVSETFAIGRNDVWMALDHSDPFIQRRNVSSYEVLGRLAPGLSLAQARERVRAQAAVLQQAYPVANRGRDFALVPLAARIAAPAARPIAIALAAALLSLAVALANLTTLAIGRLTARAGELAIRRSLGATPWRLMRQLFVENAFVTLAGALAGTGAGAWLVSQISAASAARLPRADALRFDGPVWAGVACLTILLALVPQALALFALGARPAAPSGARLVGGPAKRWRRGLVGAELALALVLAAGAGALGVSLVHLMRVDAGFNAGGALAFRASAYAPRYADREQTVAFFTKLTTALRALPGVETASAGSSLPMSGQSTGSSLMSERDPKPDADRLPVGWQTVAPGYFAAAGIPIVRGRDVTPEDLSRPNHVTILNAAAARALFGDADPIGRRVSVGGGEADHDWHEVIGVAGDVRHVGLSTAAAPRVYDAFGQHWGRTLYVVLRAAPGANLGDLEAAARRTVHDLDPDVPVFEMASLGALRARSIAAERLAAMMAAGLAATAALLACIGTFTVVSCSVSERTGEMAVRLALGAPRGRVTAMVLGESMLMAMAGCAAGGAGAWAALRALASQLYGFTTADAASTIALLGAALGLAAALAAWWPARQAAQANPLDALRSA